MQPRDSSGRFGRVATSAPEVQMPPSVAVGHQVSHAGAVGYRVVGINGDTLTLRPPQGGRVLCKAADVREVDEDPFQREENIRAEAEIARMLVTVRALSRARREALNAPTGDRERAALDELAGLYADGRLPTDRYLYAMAATKGAPLAASHTALALLTRGQLSGEAYDVLTSRMRRAGVTV